MDKEELKIKLRSDYNNYIISLVKKDKCKICGVEEDLIVHHEKAFINQFIEVLELLNLNKETFNETEIEIIRLVMLGSQIKYNNITLCSNCHKIAHNNCFINANEYKNIDKILKINNELIPLLDDIYNGVNRIYTEDKQYLLDILIDIGLRRSDGSKNIGIKTINEFLKDNNIKYQLNGRRTSKRINGIPKLYTYWELIVINIK